MADKRSTKRKVIGGVQMLNAIERKAALMAGYGSIYFIGHEGDEPAAPIKVGYTYCIMTRLVQFRNSSWKAPKVHEVLYVRGPNSTVTQRRFEMLLGDGTDPELEAKALDEAADLDKETAHIVQVEKAIHWKLKGLGLHHAREWFRGGPEFLVKTAREVIADQFDVPCYGHNSMRRLAATWSKEAGIG